MTIRQQELVVFSANLHCTYFHLWKWLMAKYVHTHPKDLKASDARGEGRSSGQHHGTRKIESCQVEPAQGIVTISSNYSKSGYRRKIQSINLTIIPKLMNLFAYTITPT